MTVFRGSRYLTAQLYTLVDSDNGSVRTLVDNSRTIAALGRSITHRVTAYDSLESIAYLYYQDATKWWLIADVNGIINPLNIGSLVGTVLDIPK